MTQISSVESWGNAGAIKDVYKDDGRQKRSRTRNRTSVNINTKCWGERFTNTSSEITVRFVPLGKRSKDLNIQNDLKLEIRFTLVQITGQKTHVLQPWLVTENNFCVVVSNHFKPITYLTRWTEKYVTLLIRPNHSFNEF